MRQLAVRARRHVEERRPRFEASREQRERARRPLLRRRHRRATSPALEALLADDVGAARRRRRQGAGAGAGAVRPRGGSRTLRNWARTGQRLGGGEMRRVDVNGQPGAMLLDRRGPRDRVMALDIADGQIQGIRSIVNPDKLGHLGRGGRRGALLRARARARRCCARSRSARRSPCACSAALSPSKISRWRSCTQVRFSSSTARPLGVSATVTRRRSSSSLRSRSTNPRVSSPRSARVAVGTATRAARATSLTVSASSAIASITKYCDRVSSVSPPGTPRPLALSTARISSSSASPNSTCAARFAS